MFYRNNKRNIQNHSENIKFSNLTYIKGAHSILINIDGRSTFLFCFRNTRYYVFCLCSHSWQRDSRVIKGFVIDTVDLVKSRGSNQSFLLILIQISLIVRIQNIGIHTFLVWCSAYGLCDSKASTFPYWWSENFFA